jgi:hypothetical protein
MSWNEPDQDSYQPHRWMHLSEMPVEIRAAVHGRTVQEQQATEQQAQRRKEVRNVVQGR